MKQVVYIKWLNKEINPLSLTSDNEIQLTVQYHHMQLKQDRVHISKTEMLFNIWFSKEQLQP